MNDLSIREKYPPEIREWWECTLKNPRFIVAPMVDASELAWRMLSRRYKADLCYTPMLHSRIFTEDAKYRSEHLFNCVSPEDRPLLVQFCGNDPEVLVKAAALVKPYCDGVDINLGCPQRIAKTGHYGAFLQDEWDLISQIVTRIRKEVNMPISCKIRIFPDINKTIAYAKMLEKSGCYMLTVHGRTREQKGMDTGLANWEYIKLVREAVNIPVVANGNIQYLPDVERCIAETGVEGVMSAEGNLHNPKLFSGINPPIWEAGLEYLELVKKYPCPMGYCRGHLFKLYHHILQIPENIQLRDQLGSASSVSQFIDVTLELKSRYEAYVTGDKIWTVPDKMPELLKLLFPPYICQPYVRPPKKLQETLEDTDEIPKKRQKVIIVPDNILAKFPPGTNLSNNILKKMAKKPNRNWGAERQPIITCEFCVNPRGTKCVLKSCKKCCKIKCETEKLDCESHKTFLNSAKTKENLEATKV